MKPRACVVATSELTIRAFLVPQLRAMQEHYDVTVVVSTPNTQLLRDLGVEATLAPVVISRTIAPWRDTRALWSLFRLIKRCRFDIVHSITPKAGFLGMVAAWLAGVPVRVHTFTGQVWATRQGLARRAFRALDKVLSRAATATLADSRSQRDFLVREGVVQASSVAVLGNGSVSGVDGTKFRPDSEARRRVRERLSVPSGDVLLLFVGRLTKDKGVSDLASAFDRIAADRSDVHLLIVGPDEGRMRTSLEARCRRHRDRLHFLEFTDRPHEVMAASDVLCLPSYREGFGSVIIEAAACGLPAVASRIYGIVDAVEEGRTGLLHQPGDVESLTTCLRRVIEDPGLRNKLGSAANARAREEFRPALLTAALLDLYSSLLAGAGELRPVDQPQEHSRPERRPGYSSSAKANWYTRFGKRALDIGVAGPAIVLLTPLFLVLALAVRARLGSPVLFKQQRPGRHNVPFFLVKFRSMTDRYDRHGHSLPDGDRLTRFGRFLRASSLDELPELWNVLVGDMSLVGPRPLLMEYLPRYTARQAVRHQVKPGITGLAQVSGRNGLSWEKRFELDLRYVDRCSLSEDLKILTRTVWQVVSRRGISQPGHVTVEKFMGVEGR
jgi:lipopolysaccharide/colanic/teichoic acid biosynthesis glycosyltransferase/glycosyltransferase involved in cell wall biosynthesis